MMWYCVILKSAKKLRKLILLKDLDIKTASSPGLGIVSSSDLMLWRKRVASQVQLTVIHGHQKVNFDVPLGNCELLKSSCVVENESVFMMWFLPNVVT
uniref:Uncharacterized protein n=1 Tax=Kalanchoe fedtschenkoi TaxID=63787 RepID=A0A7N0UEC5_KALFE